MPASDGTTRIECYCPYEPSGTSKCWYFTRALGGLCTCCNTGCLRKGITGVVGTLVFKSMKAVRGQSFVSHLVPPGLLALHLSCKDVAITIVLQQLFIIASCAFPFLGSS